MYDRHGFDSYGTVNFEHVIFPQKHMKDLNDVLGKAFHAGLITHYGKLIIFGTGAERGTWYQFANVQLKGLTFYNARESLTWYTNIYSLAQRNQGNQNSTRKKNFWLSQLQEIEPILQSFGLKDEFEQKWQNIKSYDDANGLKEEWETNGKIENWQNRTKTEVIEFLDRENVIIDSVISDIMTDSSIPQLMTLNGIKDPVEALGNAFIEGTRGLTLSTDDLTALRHVESILKRYAA